MNLNPYASTMLTVCAIIQMGMGVYFALIRPELLPEDIRYMGLSPQQLQATAPGLSNWLDKVFWVAMCLRVVSSPVMLARLHFVSGGVAS